ncbi:MAG: site-2 protease family protein, partial [Pirellulaceae bacterium]
MAGDLIPEFDRRVRELANQTLRLREDLILAPGFTAGPDSYSIEDPLTGKFYYLGPREFAFVNRLDGTTSLGEILRQTASRSDQALTQVEAATLCRWLIDQQLVRTSSPLRHEATESRSTAPPAAARFNPLACKLPVLDPDRLLAHLERSWGWVFGRTALIGWLGAVGCALAQLAAKSNQLADASQGILATDNWLWLGCCWLILKFIHELAHGIVCKRYSGNVREAGVLLVLFTPVAYVDITSAWRFRSKWQRIHVALAGMYAELLLASAATCLWAWSTDERVRDIALNVMIMASITTLAFNANPLLKFDGYYVLADWLEVPNLAANGTRIWAGWLRWFILGLPSPPAALPARQRQIVAVYGLASLVWRTLVTLSLVLAASVLFAGAGIVLAVIGAAIWWLIPLVQALRSIWAQRFGRVSWVRCGIASTLLGGGLVSLFTVIPWTGPHRAPAVVEFAPLEVVRANSSGFVAHLHVRTGDTVRRGDHLVTLHNPDLVRELEELDVQIRQAQLKSHMQIGRA